MRFSPALLAFRLDSRIAGNTRVTGILNCGYIALRGRIVGQGVSTGPLAKQHIVLGQHAIKHAATRAFGSFGNPLLDDPTNRICIAALLQISRVTAVA